MTTPTAVRWGLIGCGDIANKRVAPALRETAAATNFTSRVDLSVLGQSEAVPAGEWGFGRVADTEVAVALPRVDLSAERTRLEKELAEAEAHADRLTKQLANETFRSKAPAHVIQGMETTLSETASRRSSC